MSCTRMPLSVVDASKRQLHGRYISKCYIRRLQRVAPCGVPQHSTLTKVHPSVVFRYGFHRDFSRKLALKFIEVSVAHANCDNTVIVQ